ncbi:hypothetical protein T310_6712, partial [Rasamsonia emersonii CBS 393.64]
SGALRHLSGLARSREHEDAVLLDVAACRVYSCSVCLFVSLPGAIGMYCLSLGVQHINEILPRPAYALLSGLNASTVGIIALAAVQLAEKAIKDKLTRLQVILGACAGLCYNALWYFPVLMIIGGLATVIWDGWLSREIGKARAALQRRRRNPQPAADDETGAGAGAAENSIPLEERQTPIPPARSESTARSRKGHPADSLPQNTSEVAPRNSEEGSSDHVVRVRAGITIAVLFFASFIAILVARGVVHSAPLPLDLFANMYLAGTIIFGGGPVVIPLLRSYVVDPGWVTSRDFLIGLAIIQAFPGPNFNFAVFLGALVVLKSGYPTILGAFLGYLGIFVPGITLAIAVQSFWRVLRRRKWVVDLLRGINATAVGLVFTAVYRLWEIGYLTPEASSGKSLGLDPWWVVVATVAYAETAWFKVPAAAAIVFGAVLGLCWYGVVQA